MSMSSDLPTDGISPFRNKAHKVWLARSASACIVTALYLTFQLAPHYLDFTTDARDLWSLVWWVATPLGATLLCTVAAARSSSHDRRAFRDFAIASALWAIGTVTWQFFDRYGVEQPFPGLSDVAYLGTCLFCVVGTFHYSAADRLITRLQICTFVLGQSAIAIAIFLALLPIMQSSKLTGLGTLVAYLYPVAWGGTAAFATLCLFIYTSAHRRVTLGLLLAGLLAQGTADTIYALDLMGASYVVGTTVDGVWILGFLLIAWAAAEHLIRHCHSTSGTSTLSRNQQLAEACIPAAALLLIMASSSVPGVASFGHAFLWVLPPAVVFSFSLGLRQHWSLLVERNLRDEATSSREELSQVLESTTDSVLVINRNWQILYVNQQAHRLLSKAAGFRLGANLWDLYPQSSEASFRQHYENAFSTQRPVVFEEFVSEADIWVSVHAYPAKDRLSVFFRDVTEQRKNAADLQFLAHHDPLTGLSNRTVFERRLTAELQGDSEVAILWLDVDDFKTINDSLGHPVGDQFLIEVASRLRACVPLAPVVARMGGDEFAVLMTDEPVPDQIAEHIVEVLRDPVWLQERMVTAGVSIGIAKTADKNVSANELIKHADIALYKAKAAGNGSVRIFEPKMQEELLQRALRLAQLRKALENSELELLYQPIVDLGSNRVSSLEALLRWRHPEMGVISPVDFIPLAEESGMINAIGAWVLRRACVEARNWPSHISVSVNLSPLQFKSSDLLHEVQSALAAASLGPDRLELEITESVLMNDSDGNMEILHRLRESGVRIALDDFGTGYSSLAYVQKFPFSKIKIDKSFISGIDCRIESQAIVKSIAQLGLTLGVDITAEGIETQQQLDRVREKGCTQAQGYLFSRPVPVLAVLPVICRIEDQVHLDSRGEALPQTAKLSTNRSGVARKL